jgi:hypothetical protein
VLTGKQGVDGIRAAWWEQRQELCEQEPGLLSNQGVNNGCQVSIVGRACTAIVGNCAQSLSAIVHNAIPSTTNRPYGVVLSPPFIRPRAR